MAEKRVNKVIYHYLITSAEAFDFLNTISPFIIDKKPQVDLALVFHERKNELSPSAKKMAYRKMMELKK